MAVSSSGGHIYPALALAERLSAGLRGKDRDGLEIHFVYPPAPLAEKILSSSPYPKHPLALGGMAGGQNFFQKFKTLLQLAPAFLKAVFLIQKIKPDLILGLGGSLSAPVLTAGFFLGKKRAIWEGNTQLGLANQFLSVFTKTVFTAFPKVSGLNPKKQIWSSYPLRKGFNLNASQAENLSSRTDAGLNSSPHSSLKPSDSLPEQSRPVAIDFPKEKFKVLILGGSQGSVFFNQVVSSAISGPLAGGNIERGDWREDLFIYHQTGERSFEWVSKKYQSLKNISVFPFTGNIKAYYQNCDLIFSRAGAGSIWESAYFSKSLVLIPLTHSAGGHQLKNGLSLYETSCVDLILEKDFNPQSFKDKILELKNNPEKRKALGVSLNQMQKKEDKILEWIWRALY